MLIPHLLDALRRRLSCALLVGVVVATAACDSGSTPTGPTPPQSGGTVNAVIDGVGFTSTVVIASNEFGRVSITAISANLSRIISLNITAVQGGTFGGPNLATVAVAESPTIRGFWTTVGITPTGSYTILSQSSTEVRGTFSFVATPAREGTPPVSKAVTDGMFDVTF